MGCGLTAKTQWRKETLRFLRSIINQSAHDDSRRFPS